MCLCTRLGTCPCTRRGTCMRTHIFTLMAIHRWREGLTPRTLASHGLQKLELPRGVRSTQLYVPHSSRASWSMRSGLAYLQRRGRRQARIRLATELSAVYGVVYSNRSSLVKYSQTSQTSQTSQRSRLATELSEMHRVVYWSRSIQHVHSHACVHTYTHAYTHVYTRAYTHACKHA